MGVGMGSGRPQMPVSMGGVPPPAGPQIPVVPQRPSPRYGPSYPGPPSASPMGGSFPGMRPGSLGGSATASPVPGGPRPQSTPPAPDHRAMGNVRGLSPGPGVVQHTRPFYEPNTTVEYYSP